MTDRIETDALWGAKPTHMMERLITACYEAERDEKMRQGDRK